MWLNNTAKSSKTKELVLPSRILLLSTLLVCSNLPQNHCAASAEAQQLDPTLILLGETQTAVAPQEQHATVQGDTATVPDIELTASKPHQTAAECFGPDARPLPFSTAYFQAAFEQEGNSLEQKTSDKQYVTAKTGLVKASISSVVESPDSQNKHLLSRLVEQISSVRFARRPTEPQISDTRGPQKQDEPKKIIEVAPEPNKSALGVPPPAQEHQEQSARTLSPQTIERIEQIINLAAKTQEPQLLAEMLHQAGLCEQAAYFYELAVNADDRMQPADADKAWLLTQRGLCLSGHDPQQALQVYRNVASLYPDTPWVELAKTRQSLTEWLSTDQPEKLIEQCKAELKQTGDN